MKPSFVMIVLNGMPFIEFSLQAIYDFAYEVVIIEGAVKTCMFAANPDGSSKDGTIEFIESFPDPENKIKIIRGTWSEKCEMQNEALKQISGDYVWLVDSDEVYHKKDIQKVIRMLKEDSTITRVDFFPYNFWKGFDYIMSSPKLVNDAYSFRRVFKFIPGAVFTNHRPITMSWGKGVVKKEHIIKASRMMKEGIRFCHYSYVLANQVYEKTEYRCRRCGPAAHGVNRMEWFEKGFLKWTPKNRKEIEKKYSTWSSDLNACSKLFEGTHPEVMLGFIEKFKRDSI